jgi:RNA polymerase sigma-70 factor (ECF subfamily)
MPVERVDPPAVRRDEFATTHWSLVVAAGDQQRPDASQALAQLCELYWYPLYTYIRRRVADVNEAQDFTQTFFERLIEKRQFEAADPERGRFRAFLLTACKRFLINEWHKARAAKRGGGQRPLSLDFNSGESKFSQIAEDSRTAEQLYDQQWAMTLLDQVLQKLRLEYAAKNKQGDFEILKPFLAGSTASGAHAKAARALGITEGAAKVAAHRLRKRYRELLRAAIAETVERPEQVDDEIRDLFAALGAK